MRVYGWYRFNAVGKKVDGLNVEARGSIIAASVSLEGSALFCEYEILVQKIERQKKKKKKLLPMYSLMYERL